MLKNIDLVLIAIGFGNEFDKAAISKIIDIKPVTMEKHLKTLEKSGFLERISNEYFILTEKGDVQYDKLMNIISDLDLIPDKHSVTRIIKMHSILSLIKDPKSLMKIIISINNNKELDIIELFRLNSALKPGSLEHMIMDELIEKGETVTISTDDQFKDLTMIGRKPGEIIEDILPVREVLIRADLRRRAGKPREALDMFLMLLHSRDGLLPGEWITCLIGWITCVKMVKDPEKALEIINEYLGRELRPEHKALLLYLKADILSDKEINNDATKCYFKSLKMMRALDMNISKAELLNSHGVHLYRMNNFSHAEQQWRKSRELSIKYGLPWIKALTEINLSDVYSRKGKFRTAHDLLRRAEKVLYELNDPEGLSGVHFNRSLLLAREGKLDKARESFSISEEFPLVYNQKRDERRRVFEECIKENENRPVRDPI
jgi:tetratricopeptide (TPR) repeat protein